MKSLAYLKTCRLWTAFRSGEEEEAFHRHNLTRTRASLRQAMITGSILYIVFAFADISTLGYTNHTLILLLARVSFSLMTVCCLYCMHRWPASILVVQLVATVIGVVGMAVFMAVTWYVPTEFLRHAMSMCALLMLVYFFVPNRLIISTAIALASSVVFILIDLQQREIHGFDAPALLMLLLINGFGFSVAARLHRHLREEFRTQVAMEKQAHALNEALRYAEEKNQQKIETVGYIGHDLRAPLSTISAYSKRLLDLASDDQIPLIQAIERSIDYQLGLIGELMEYTKAELQPLNVEPIPTDISALLSGIAEYATALCARQDNQFQYRLPTTLPKLMEIDGRRLQQVLLNLLSNASKFTREGTVTLTVSVIPLGQRCRIGFDVSDTGIGIDLTRQTDIFGAFKQIQAVNGGTGLGLFIAQRIVSAMGGELGVASTPGHGTSFSFEFTTQALEHETTSWPNVSHFTPVPSVATQPHCRDWVDTAVPPKADRDELAKLAEQGRLTDIEQWISQFSDVASYSSFLAKVRLRLARLDFFGIEALVAAADHASHEQD